jgi:hypothetical protein
MRRPGTARSNGDRAAFPILGPQCPESIDRLARFDREQWFREGPVWRSEGTVDKGDGLDEHARLLLACVQRELSRRGPKLDHDAAVELAKSRKVALEALTRLSGNQYAKTVQAEVSPGPALAICTGTGYVRHVKTVVGVIRFQAMGCGAVFEDSTRLSGGRMWPSWCPDCRPSKGKRRVDRTQARELQRRARL